MASWFLAPALVKLRQQLLSAYPNRDRSTDGAIGDAAHNARKSYHNADWDSTPRPGIVRAIDVDKDLFDAGNTPDSVTQALVDSLIRDKRVAYVIFRSRIWQNPAVYNNGGWLPYINKPAGSPNPHNEHFHLSIRHGNAYEYDLSEWPVNNAREWLDMVSETELRNIIRSEIREAFRGDLLAITRTSGRVPLLQDTADIRTSQIAWDKRRTLESGMEYGFVRGPGTDDTIYAVMVDGSLTPFYASTWKAFRNTIEGATTVVGASSISGKVINPHV